MDAGIEGEEEIGSPNLEGILSAFVSEHNLA